MVSFDRFLAVDWSGARGERQREIQIAYLNNDHHAGPSLLRLPDAKNWGRVVVKDLIVKLMRSDLRTLIGFDFCFSVPWPEDGKADGPLPEARRKMEHVEELWRLVDSVSADEPHYYAGPVVRDRASPFSSYILCDRYRGEQFRFDRFRETERRVSPKPASIYYCMGARPSAPGSFAGMRMLNALKSMSDARIAIWPFDPIDEATVVLCEIYPSLFCQMAGMRRAYDGQTILQTLMHYGSGSPPDMNMPDEADAVVCVAAVRSLANEEALFSPPGRPVAAKREGWILGVKPS